MSNLRQLKTLSLQNFADDVKQYIRTPHEFYKNKLPELKTLGKRLYEEYKLRDFYRIFNRLWSSGYQKERSLAIHSLEKYEKEFDLKTWVFLKPKLREAKSWDELDCIAEDIIGKILLRFPVLEREIAKLGKSSSVYERRAAIVSTLPLIKNNRIRLSMFLLENNLFNKEESIQKVNGWILREIGKVKPEIAKRFILKHMNMPANTFIIATENMKGLRKIKGIKKLRGNRF